MMSPNLSSFAVKQRSVTLYFILLSVLAGTYAFASLGRAEDPAITLQMVVVSAVWPGATPAEIERQVVLPIEKKIQEVDYVEEINTTVKADRADLQVKFYSYTPMDKLPELQFQLRKRMLDIAASLPKGVIGPLVNDDFADVYFSLYSLSAPTPKSDGEAETKCRGSAKGFWRAAGVGRGAGDLAIMPEVPEWNAPSDKRNTLESSRHQPAF